MLVADLTVSVNTNTKLHFDITVIDVWFSIGILTHHFRHDLPQEYGRSDEWTKIETINKTAKQ
jgi:hypothetical protein